MANTNEMIMLKNNNFNMILDALKKNDEMTISAISEETNLSIPTIKKAIDYCLKVGMITESNIAPSTGGRKAQLFKICDDYFFAIYIAIDNNDIICKVENFKNQICFNEKKGFSVVNLKNEIDYFFKKVETRFKRIRVISISLPCVIDNGKVVEWFYNPQLNGVNFKEYLESTYNVMAVVQNDMNLTVMAVGSRLESPQDNVVATLQLGHNGIGVGQFANGDVLSGNCGFAGEISYIYDITKNVKSIKYCSKIVRNLLVFLNPREIVFYRSYRQNRISEIMDEATKNFPRYAVPIVTISDGYLEDVFEGLKLSAKDILKIDVADIKLE